MTVFWGHWFRRTVAPPRHSKKGLCVMKMCYEHIFVQALSSRFAARRTQTRRVNLVWCERSNRIIHVNLTMPMSWGCNDFVQHILFFLVFCGKCFSSILWMSSQPTGKFKRFWNVSTFFLWDIFQMRYFPMHRYLDNFPNRTSADKSMRVLIRAGLDSHFLF